MAYTETPSAKSAVASSHSDFRQREQYVQLKDTLFDDVLTTVTTELMDQPMTELFNIGTMDKMTETEIETLPSSGTMQVLDPTASMDEMPYITNQEGFSILWEALHFALGAKWTVQWANEEAKLNVKDVSDAANNLQDAATRTMRNVMADALSRGVDPTTTQFLCADGMALCDSARPNPDPRAGSWSNLVALGDITEDYFFDVNIQAKQQIGPNGDRLGLEIMKVFYPEEYAQVIYHLDKTKQELDTANNTVNWAAGRFEAVPLKYLTANNIFFKLADDNRRGMKIRWQEKLNIKNIGFESPDWDGKRIRGAFATGCFDPRYSLLGGKLNALA